jgi:hypothetical protein
MRTPRTEPITNASTDSISVIQRWSQIVPSENQRAIRRATFSGVAKKNVGRIGASKNGTAGEQMPERDRNDCDQKLGERGACARDTIKRLLLVS